MSPSELVNACNDSLDQLINSKDKDSKKASDELSKHLQAIKVMMHGTSEQTPPTEQVNTLVDEMHAFHMLHRLVIELERIDFEGRKDVGTIFNTMLRHQVVAGRPTVDYVFKKPEIIHALVKGYESQEIALNCGIILREISRHAELVKIIFDSPDIYQFFDYVGDSTSEIASDAFATFKELLTKHKLLSAGLLEKEYDRFFGHYQRLLNSENYVTRRQALELLGELLLDRHNLTAMDRYTSSADNLKLMMNLLLEKSSNVQFEAFQVFKIFVPKPNKTKQVLDIFLRNKEKLVEFLGNFHPDRTVNERFNDEKSYLMMQISELEPMP